MCTAIKHPVPDRVMPSFVIFDILDAHVNEYMITKHENY